MNNNQKGQVQLSRLIFTHNWEDPTVDEEALRIKPGDTLFTITSGGCNALGFLRFDPSFIYCLDINPAQTALLELKKAAFACLAYDEMLEFLGLRPNSNRLRMYDEIKKKMSAEARYFWDHHSTIIKRGINMGGRYERFSKMAGMLVRFLQGEKKTRDFFQLETLEEQAEFYNKNWDNRRWRWIFNRMFNKKRLAGKGLDADYFHFDDGSASFSESFYRRAGHAMTNIPAASNYFLCLYLLGHYRDEDHLPDYLQQKNFEIIRKNIGRLRPVTGDGKYWLQQQPANLFDAMSLSNICELMDDKDTHTLFSEVERTAKKSARLIFRNLMVPREVPEVLQPHIVKDEPESRRLQQADRSFVYGKVAVYEVRK